MKVSDYVGACWRLSRAPFLSVGILPLTLGFVLAWRGGYQGPKGLYLLSMIAVLLIMWMTYYLGERNDFEGDRLNQSFNRFSGGSRVLVEGVLPLWVSLLLGYGCLLGAILIGVYIYFQYRTGPWTLLLGGIGIFSGFFYSSKPFQWSHRGLGRSPDRFLLWMVDHCDRVLSLYGILQSEGFVPVNPRFPFRL